MTGEGTAAVEVVSLGKRYGDVVAVADVSFTVARGEIFGILGHNGAGKTTTVECIQALRRSERGSIRVEGIDAVAQPGRVSVLVGSQLQSSSLPDRLRVGEALEFFAAIRPGGWAPAELLEEWGLTELRRRAFGDLSGGQQQRLFVALALINDAHQRPAGGDPRRDDHRPRPGCPARRVGAGRAGPGPWRDRPARHALHGRGGAPV